MKKALAIIGIAIFLALGWYIWKRESIAYRCGTIAGISCPAGYRCEYDSVPNIDVDTHYVPTDLGGHCVRE